MVSTRATPGPDAGPSGQHDTAPNDVEARLAAVRAQADLQEQENRLALALQEARRIDAADQADPAGLRRSNGHDESSRDEAPLGPTREASPEDSATFLGENFPQNVIAMSNLLPGVDAQDIDDVRTGKLNFLNLIRLHPSLGQRPSDNEGASVVDISGGTIVHRKKTHTLRDYPGPLVFFHCFHRYIWIYEQFHRKEHPGVASAQLDFGIFIMHQAEVYAWDKCLKFAMDRLNTIRTSGVHKAELWEDRAPRWIHEHFTYAPPPLAPVSQKRQRTNTSGASGDSAPICYRYNTRQGCRGNCHRRHVCLGCESTEHIDANCTRQ
ncbi:hypothetical protein E4U44_006056 [Claviceps purpurea]|nr:hypothetical protein E4U44_006056 [Claviceps purpurea]